MKISTWIYMCQSLTNCVASRPLRLFAAQLYDYITFVMRFWRRIQLQAAKERSRHALLPSVLLTWLLTQFLFHNHFTLSLNTFPFSDLHCHLSIFTMLFRGCFCAWSPLINLSFACVHLNCIWLIYYYHLQLTSYSVNFLPFLNIHVWEASTSASWYIRKPGDSKGCAQYYRAHLESTIL